MTDKERDMLYIARLRAALLAMREYEKENGTSD